MRLHEIPGIANHSNNSTQGSTQGSKQATKVQSLVWFKGHGVSISAPLHGMAPRLVSRGPLYAVAEAVECDSGRATMRLEEGWAPV